MNLSLKKEADYIEDLARRDKPAAIARLDALLDRIPRLDGHDKDTAMSFNAKLVTELRERGVRLFVVYQPPTSPTGQGLPMRTSE